MQLSRATQPKQVLSSEFLDWVTEELQQLNPDDDENETEQNHSEIPPTLH